MSGYVAMAPQHGRDRGLFRYQVELEAALAAKDKTALLKNFWANCPVPAR